MKRLSFLLSFFFVSTILLAQAGFQNEINKSLELVIGDYPNLYANIKGELIGQSGKTLAYTSKVEVQGAVSTAVTVNSSYIKDDVNWKAILWRTKDFKEAKVKYHQYFAGTKNGIINSGSERPYILTGNYKEPLANAPTLVNFQLLPSTLDIKNLVVELFMEKVQEEWVISISVYNK